MNRWYHCGWALLALVAAFAACKKEADVVAGKPAKVLAGTPLAAPPVDTRLGPLPQGVLLVAGYPSFDILKSFLDNVSRGFGQKTDIDKIMGDAALAEIILKSQGIDRSKPAYLALWNPKADEGYSLVIPLANQAGFEMALGDRKNSQMGAGNAFALNVASGPIYANYLGTAVVFSNRPATYAKYKDFLTKAGNAFKPIAPVQVLVSVPNLLAAWSADIAEFKQMIRQLAESGGSLMMGNASKFIGDFYGIYIDKLLALASEMESVDIRIQANQERLQVQTLVAVKPQGSLHQAIRTGEKGGSAALGLMPSDAYAVLAANIDPDLFKGWQGPATDMLAAVLKLDDARKKDLAAVIEQSYAVQTGDVAYALYPVKEFPFCAAGAALVKDGPKVKELLGKLSDLYLQWVKSMTQQFAAMGGPQLDFSSWKNLIEGLGDSAKQFGVALDVKDSGDIQGMGLELDYDKLPAGEAAQKEKVKQAIGNEWQFGIGFGQKIVSVAFGPNGFDAAEKVLKGSFSYESTVFLDSMKRAAAHPFVIVWLDLGAALQAAAPMVELFSGMFRGDNNIGAQLRSVKAGAPFSFTIGGTGTTLQTSLDLPFAPILSLRELAH